MWESISESTLDKNFSDSDAGAIKMKKSQIKLDEIKIFAQFYRDQIIVPTDEIESIHSSSKPGQLR